MIIFLDTETTGLPRNWKAPVTDLANWPRMVQLAWLVYDDLGVLQSQHDFIIKPVGYLIPKEASKVHGITHERALAEGKDMGDALSAFAESLQSAKLAVAHNMSFDEKIIGAEFLRAKFPDLLARKQKLCTMHGTTDYCKLSGPYGYKWPKLNELHFKVFGRYFEEAHNAAVDIKATADCFWELRRRGVF